MLIQLLIQSILSKFFQQFPRPPVPGIELEGFLGGFAGFIFAAEGLEDLAFAPPGAGVAGGAAFEGFAEDLVEGGEAFGAVEAADGGHLAELQAEKAGGVHLGEVSWSTCQARSGRPPCR